MLNWWFARPTEILLNLLIALIVALIRIGRDGCGCWRPRAGRLGRTYLTLVDRSARLA